MNHRSGGNWDKLRFQIRNLKFQNFISSPCLCVSLVKRLCMARRTIVLLLLTFILTNQSSLNLRAAASTYTRQHSLASRDEAFLEDLERRMFRYFWEQADPNTGLVP